MTTAKLTDNPFELLGQPQRFAIDQSSLERSYRQIQSRVHPDRFVRAMDAERRIAMQLSTQANEAFRLLQDPVARALYLCRVNGVTVDTDRGAGLGLEFLEEQMTWREALDEARGDAQQLAALRERIEAARGERIRRLAEYIDDRQDYASAAREARELLFVDKFKASLRLAEVN